MRRYVVEFIGTFFLVFTIGTTVLGGFALAPLAIGAALMVMVYAGGHISGAHYNPAVTTAVTLRGRLATADVAPYVGAQLLGALLAGGAARWVENAHDVQATDYSGRGIGVALVAEFIFTFALAWVVLNVATSKDHPDNSFYGLAIGFTVLAGAFAVGPVSSGAFNPAVALGLCVMGLLSWGSLWIYVVANLAGAALAAYAFRFVSPDDLEPSVVAPRTPEETTGEGERSATR